MRYATISISHQKTGPWMVEQPPRTAMTPTTSCAQVFQGMENRGILAICDQYAGNQKPSRACSLKQIQYAHIDARHAGRQATFDIATGEMVAVFDASGDLGGGYGAETTWQQFIYCVFTPLVLTSIR